MHVPAGLRREYAAWKWEVTWRIVPHAVTFRLRRGAGEVRFLKLAEADRIPSLLGEAERITWAARRLPVPNVVDSGSDGAVEWLLTEALPGRDATHQAWAGEPERLVRALARGLRDFHRIPADDCPFDFGLERALALARARLREDRIHPGRDFHPEFAHLSAAAAVERLASARPASEDRVVCHGDYCFPNVLLSPAWTVVGFVDLGELGVADRWWDLAVATWSASWNLGPGFEDLFLEEYGVERSDDRIAYYRLLYDVVS
jgi:kanamycin kinase